MIYRSKKRSKKKDLTRIQMELDGNIQEEKRLQEAGEKYLQDKKQIEFNMDVISRSDLPSDVKQKGLKLMIQDVRKTEKEFEAAVVKPMEEIEERVRENVSEMEDSIREMARVEATLRRTKIEAASTDMTTSADELSAERVAYEELRKKTIDRLSINMRQREMLERNMREKKFRR